MYSNRTSINGGPTYMKSTISEYDVLAFQNEILVFKTETKFSLYLKTETKLNFSFLPKF